MDDLKMKNVLILDMTSLMCLLDGEAVELEDVVIAPGDDVLKAHRLAVAKSHLRKPEPEFHL